MKFMLWPIWIYLWCMWLINFIYIKFFFKKKIVILNWDSKILSLVFFSLKKKFKKIKNSFQKSYKYAENALLYA